VDGKVLGGNPAMKDGLWWNCQRKERLREWWKKESTIYAHTGFDPWVRITIIRTCDQAPSTSLDIVIDIIWDSSSKLEKEIKTLKDSALHPITWSQILKDSLSLIHNLTNQTSYKADCFICAPLQKLLLSSVLISNITLNKTTCTLQTPLSASNQSLFILLVHLKGGYLLSTTLLR
jgi:hypothetical protein